ncbi:MAG TPA: NAD-dependent epimerase/dehydratase family protein [Polyangiales bacterium]|nr:NAD-dependent epimerase/dehydratase family protein [Polyangiales bacterium]
MTPLLGSDIEEVCTSLGPAASAFAGKRVLITGARGFLGRYFTEVLLRLNAVALSEPCEIIAIDNLRTAGEMGAEIPKVKHMAFINHDIVKPFYPERPVDYVLHLAGIASPYYYRKWPLETLEVATTGLRNVLELARQSSARIVFFSSSEIYGDPDPVHVPTKESYHGNVSCLGARACYDESKRLGETLIRIFHDQFGVSGMIVRPFNVYGPGMQKHDYRVLPNFAARVLAGEPLNVYGNGRQTRTFCYVSDAIRGFLQVLLQGQPGEPYNIGNPKPEISMLELVQVIREVVPELDAQHRVIEHPDTYPADEPQRRCPDITKAMLQVGYEPHVSLEVGLKRFFDWARIAYA